jgi:hypothetical protein
LPARSQKIEARFDGLSAGPPNAPFRVAQGQGKVATELRQLAKFWLLVGHEPLQTLTYLRSEETGEIVSIA